MSIKGKGYLVLLDWFGGRISEVYGEALHAVLKTSVCCDHNISNVIRWVCRLFLSRYNLRPFISWYLCEKQDSTDATPAEGLLVKSWPNAKIPPCHPPRPLLSSSHPVCSEPQVSASPSNLSSPQRFKQSKHHRNLSLAQHVSCTSISITSQILSNLAHLRIHTSESATPVRCHKQEYFPQATNHPFKPSVTLVFYCFDCSHPVSTALLRYIDSHRYLPLQLQPFASFPCLVSSRTEWKRL